MKIFLDTADVDLIGQYYGTGLIDGVTTNPTLIKKSGQDPEEVYRQIALLGVDDISMEIVTDDSYEFLKEGRRLKEKFGEITTIKVPCTPEGLKACKLLSKEGIRVNVTLILVPLKRSWRRRQALPTSRLSLVVSMITHSMV